jgi:hypothetical protein
MEIYIASSWKNQHAVEMLTDRLRQLGHTVPSFVETNNFDYDKGVPFDDWIWSEVGEKTNNFDTNAAISSDLVIYVGPSGCDAWAEVGAAWASGVTVFGLMSKGEQIGLMRRMVTWFKSVDELIAAIENPKNIQLCSNCGKSTGRHEEDTLWSEDSKPLCEDCFGENESFLEGKTQDEIGDRQ